MGDGDEKYVHTFLVKGIERRDRFENWKFM
jgi:hypothetical protein